jgi:rubrerythrin
MRIIQEGDELAIADFNELEALRLALKLEDDGIKFYLRAAERAKSEDAKKVFKMLAHEEEKHVLIFKEMLEKLILEENFVSEADRGDEERFFDFIKPEIFGDIFDTEKIVAKIKGDIKAIELGEAAEVNTINFYKAILKNTQNEPGKEIIKEIMKEEQNHLKTFIRYREKLAKCK